MCGKDQPEEAASDEEDWKLLDDKLPLSISKVGDDPKGHLVYNPPKWASSSVDAKILDLSVQIVSNGVLLDTVKLNFNSFYVLGSMDECDFVYKNPQVSRKHFIMHYTRSNSLVIYDLNSKCGTTVNHMRLQPEKYYLLSAGDQIRIGKAGLSTRSYIITGHSIFDELESTQSSKRTAKESDIDKVKRIRKIERELEEELRSTKVDESYYDTNLYMDEYDEYFDDTKPKTKSKSSVLKKADILTNLLKFQRDEVDLLNNWYTLVKEATQGSKEDNEPSIDAELEKVRRRQLNQDKAKIQKQLNKVRDELEHNFKLLRIASF
ncbi:uncharacterized protein TOT_020000454 [Theileria orientalis strain Shintoku]|uniref:FHA domain-containing protein n=1 Tax=Theileria orientalis strain Shintoku TaxID=869250 RepID=J4CCY3_THEOR|nr:uncharacterized protein TOT_020000454 [Theileria orientalis strain Shintoku]PVC51569.1 hypothetical protein MACL_00001488 [Theileria orientalis]BAM40192.1 uncharacterized protein TOT_020000454 [Theileria orientalis strain Shintoku]|eukprot:XP_009690493.1 uncharacterized protein TOT_020000454 [Theileria orientalis strain Shintoku]